MADLKQEFQQYQASKAAYLEKYRGRFVVLKDGTLLGAYDDRLTAIQETAKSHPVGTFLVQLVTESDEVVRFHSRVAI